MSLWGFTATRGIWVHPPHAPVDVYGINPHPSVGKPPSG